MRVLILIPLILFQCIVFAQENCPCSPGTKKVNQQRSGAKHVTNYEDFVLKEDTITVAYMYKWERKFKTKTNTIKTTPTNPASKRKSGTPERSEERRVGKECRL